MIPPEQSTMPFGRGIIEGFYGRPWSWPVRWEWLDFLAQNQFNTYVYAPKSDRWLRSDWQQTHPPEQFQKLAEFGMQCRKLGLNWGPGISPAGLQSRAELDTVLLKRVDQLQQLAPDLICLLFDDMATVPQAAVRQAEIALQVLKRMDPKTLLAVCPTWYSDDPRLADLYGPMPVDYLRQLGQELPESVGIIWCGKQVCARSQQPRQLRSIAERLGRKPVLWDNYPVNDGKLTVDFLHIEPFRYRSAKLPEYCLGHWANPMLQPHLSKLPVAALALLYRQGYNYRPGRVWRRTLQSLCQPPLAKLLERDHRCFQHAGLTSLSKSRRRQLSEEYRSLQMPMADEVADWLDGEYRFDPAVLSGTS